MSASQDSFSVPADNIGQPKIILASGSQARRGLLSMVGLEFEAVATLLDEQEVKRELKVEGHDAKVAVLSLAEKKARAAVPENTSAWVIGADQILECDGEWFDKPPNLARAREQLEKLSGRTHRLICGVCLLKAGKVVWTHCDEAVLTMCKFEPGFLDAYIEEAGENILQTVGAYQLEGAGRRLFTSIEGNFYTILGLPLLPLLSFLGSQGIVTPWSVPEA